MKKVTPKSKKGSKLPSNKIPKISDLFQKITEQNIVKRQELSKNISNIKNSETINIDDDDDDDKTSNINECLSTVKEANRCGQSSPCKKRKSNTDDKSPKRVCVSVIPSTSSCRSPLKQIDLIVNDKNVLKTPEKRNKNLNNTSKTPPPKLFQKTPQKVHDFNVDIIENFVKITPSKSNIVLKDKTTPTSSGKVQTSILKYISPSTSNRSVEVQKMNESTPIKNESSSNASTTPLSKVRTKLNFEETDLIVVKEEKSSTLKEITKDINNTENYMLMDNNSLDEFCISQFIDVHLENECAELEDENVEEQYKLDLSKSQHCKIMKIEIFPTQYRITVKSTATEEYGICFLRDFWFNTKLDAGDSVHIMAKKINSEWVVDNQNGLMVYEPDLLISSTSVVSSLFCKRRNVLADKFQGFDPANEFMIIGTLVHSILQETLQRKLNSISQIEEVLDNILTSKGNIRRLYESDQSIADIKTKMAVYIPRILEFVESYIPDKNKNRQKRQPNKNCWQGKIDMVEDIEENIWCPELGIKGKVDVSIKSGNQSMPLELKTGKASFSLEHKGQVLLYVMMMNKLGYKVPSGLLLYLKDGIVKEIPITENEKRDIMILRNELAYFLNKKPKILSNMKKDIVPSTLPEPINHHSACGYCPYKVICSAFLEHSKTDLSANKHLKKVKDEVLSHLKEEHLNYFIRWSSLLNLEEISGNRTTKSVQEIYRVSPTEREKKGRCISYLRISEVSDECNGYFDHSFVKNKESIFNFYSSGINQGNYTVISTDQRPAIASGFVTHVDAYSITVTLDRNLRRKYPIGHFHIDTYDSSISSSFNQTSLTLLLESSPRAEQLRQIIIDKKAPTFVSKLPKVVASKGIPILKKLNKIQQRAVLKAISASDFLLIKGMPGTGKTATIVALIQLLTELGKTVFVTSHTHSAVDNVCTRLSKLGVDFLRLGSETKINENLKSYTEHYRTKDCKTPEDLTAVYNKAQVIASTCLGSGHPLLSKRSLDVCIVDESTQVLQSTIIRPLYAAKKFILIGDPEQLPPVVKSKDAVEMGMAESLFDRLQSGESTISLTLNYRMNRTITDLANLMTYNGELLVANDLVGNATLSLPNKMGMNDVFQKFKWITKALDTALENSVQIIDTGPVWNRVDNVTWSVKDNKEEKNKSVYNIYEAAVIESLSKALLKGGMKHEHIGIIATFNCQVKQLSAILDPKIEVSTVDQFQGRDKNIIIYSCTKSVNIVEARKRNDFEILEDRRRLNVAITRAKNKLIIVGDLETVKEYTPFAKLIDSVNKCHVMKLEENIDDFNWSTVLNSVKM